MISYIIHSSILLTGCYLFYWLFLRQETFFQLNRGVLMACILLPLVMPLITIPASWSLYPTAESIHPAVIYNNQITDDFRADSEIYSAPTNEVTLSEGNILPKEEVESIWFSNFSFPQILKYLYWTGIVVFTLAFLIQLFILITKMWVLQSIKDRKYRIVELVKDEAPYSFWKTIFINPEKYDLDTYEQIIAHEKIHIDQSHFIDKLILELVVIAFWFHPFVWLFRKAITNNLEYLTDHSMLTNGFEKESYQLSLLKVSVPQYPLHLTTNYNQSFLKNRIAMMNTKKSSAQSIWKYLFILPLLGLSLITMNAVEQIEPSIVKVKEPSQQVIPTEMENEPNKIQQSEPLSIKPISEPTPREQVEPQVINNLSGENNHLEPAGSVVLSQTIQLNQLYAKISEMKQAYPIDRDTVPEAADLPPAPVFPYSEADIKKAMKEDPAFAETLQQAIDEYAQKVEAWGRAISDIRDSRSAYSIANGEYVVGAGIVGGSIVGEGVVAGSGSEGQSSYATSSGVIAGSGRAYATSEKVYDDAYIIGVGEGAGLEKYYLKRSRTLDNVEWLNAPMTQLTATKGNAYWKLPELQKALLAQLQKDGYLDDVEEVNFIAGAKQIYVNGKSIAGTDYQKYVDLFRKYDIQISNRWTYEKKGDHLVVVDHVQGIEQLKKKLTTTLITDQLIKSKRQKVILEIPGDQLILNGKKLPDAMLARYHPLFKEFNILPAPGKTIILNAENKTSIGVGYKLDRAFLGTWSSRR